MRNIVNINNEWLFTKDNPFVYKRKTKWEQINLPHTWNNVDGQDGGDDYYRGKCFYQKTFAKPSYKKGQRVYIEFKGVNAVAEIYLNGKLVATHKGGYSTFRADLTDFLRKDNNLIVSCDNSVMDDVYPQVADFTFYGGIYRDVSFIIVDKYHFDLDYYGGPGYQLDSEIKGHNAYLTVKAYSNAKKVVVTVLDKEGNVVATGRNDERIKVNNVHLWNGLDDPYLYTIKLDLIVRGEIKDSLYTEYGFRTFKIDPKKGFYLNGKYHPIYGVCRHQDRQYKGNAVSKEDIEQDFSLIKEIGASCIRLAHYQHDDYVYTLCDRLGLIVWSEIPYISQHLNNGDENAISQMKELIVQTYNHPSIIIRGLSNEVDMFTHNDPDNYRNLHEKLHALVKEMDPTRYSAIAIYDGTPKENSCFKNCEVIGDNFYLGWYHSRCEDTATALDTRYDDNPQCCHCMSEYGGDALPYIHNDKLERGDFSEEYQAYYHEKVFALTKKRRNIFATFVWNMFDFGADNRCVGDDPGKNRKGLVSFDREIKKDAFYFYKASWTKEPMVHICSKRFVNRVGKNITVKVYSNQSNVELYQNGVSIKGKRNGVIYKFKMPLLNDNDVVATSNGVMDKAYFKKVDKPDPSYRTNKGTAAAWEKK